MFADSCDHVSSIETSGASYFRSFSEMRVGKGGEADTFRGGFYSEMKVNTELEWLGQSAHDFWFTAIRDYGYSGLALYNLELKERTHHSP